MKSPVATIKTPTTGLDITRDGKSVVAMQQDNLAWGDVVTNKTPTDIEVLIPAQYEGQGDTLMTLAPGASAELRQIPPGTADGFARTEVVALSEGVELYDIDNDVSSAIITPFEGTMSGLVGAGLLAGAAGGAGAAAAAGGLGLLGLATLSDDDDTTVIDDSPTTMPPPTTTMGPPTTTVEPPTTTMGPPTTTMEPPTTTTMAPTTTLAPPEEDQALGVAGALVEVGNGLEQGGEGSPLQPLTDGLAFFLAGEPELDPSGGQIADAGFAGLGNAVADLGSQVAAAGDADPTGLVPLLGTVVGDFATPEERNVGVAGGLESVARSVQEGSSDEGALTGPLQAVTEPLADGVVTLADVLVQVGDGVTAIPVLGEVLQPIVGAEAADANPTPTPPPADNGGLPIPGLDALPIPTDPSALPGFDALPIGSLPTDPTQLTNLLPLP